MGRFEILEEISKFNPYHGSDGRFSSANGAASMTVFTNSPAGQKAIANIKARIQSAAGKQKQVTYQKLTNDDALEMAKEMGQDNIDPNDVKKMTDYLSGYFGTRNSWTINDALRDGNKLRRSQQETVDTIDKHMKPSTRDVQLTRMVDDSFLEKLGLKDVDYYDENDAQKLQKAVGMVYSNPGYTSTSFDMDSNYFKRRPVQMNISAPKGTEMLVSPDRRGEAVAESEILLARNTAIKVTGIKRKYDSFGYVDGVVIDCEVIPE